MQQTDNPAKQGQEQQALGAVMPGFGSFNATAFFANQQAAQEQRRAELTKAAQQYLSSSSSEGEDGEVSPHAVRAGPSQPANRPVSFSLSDSSTTSGERSRKRKHHKKDRKHSRKASKRHKRGHPGDSERDKILRLEKQAAARGVYGATLAGSHGLASTLGLGLPTAQQELYEFDYKGDLQNIVYKGLYAGHKLVFKRKDPLGIAKGLARLQQLPGLRGLSNDMRAAADKRYFSPSVLHWERNRRMRRVHLLRAQPIMRAAGVALSLPDGVAGRLKARRGALSQSMPLPAYISLRYGEDGTGRVAVSALPTSFGHSGWIAHDANHQGDEEAPREGENMEEWILRRTKELNTATREAPLNVHTWLALADFQDEVGRQMGGRGRRVRLDAGAVANKKVAILERALVSNPGSMLLLLALMRAATSLLDPPALAARWEVALRRWQADAATARLTDGIRQGEDGGGLYGVVMGEAALWQHYLCTRQSLFPNFTYTDLQVIYTSAVSAISVGLARLKKEGASLAQIASLEVEGVRLLLDGAQTALSAGHDEAGVAQLQALLEFHAFAPSALGFTTSTGRSAPSLGASIRLWCAFWDSAAPRVGEEGAEGWATWYRRQHEDLLVGAAAAAAAQAQAAEDELLTKAQQASGGGGWSGWVLEAPAATDADQSAAEGAKEGEGQQQEQGGDGQEDGEEERDEEEEEEVDEQELLQQLGLKLEQELEGLKKQGVAPHIVTRWVAEERARSAARWAPPRAVAGTGTSAVLNTDGLRGLLFPIQAGGVVERLVLGACALLGAPLGPNWAASNQPLLLNDGPPPNNTLSHYLSSPAAHQPFAVLSMHPPPEAASHFSMSSTYPATEYAAPPSLLSARLPFVLPVVCPVPWYVADESRRAFLARTLKALLGQGAPLQGHPAASLAYLLVEATKPSSFVQDTQTAVQAGSALGQPGIQSQEAECGPSLWQEAGRAREAAKQMLAVQPQNLVMWGALAMLEALLGNTKKARQVYDAALAGSHSMPATERAEQVPPLAVQAAVYDLHAFALPQQIRAAQVQQQGITAAAAVPVEEVPYRMLRALHCLIWLLSGGAQNGGSSFRPAKPSDLPPSASAVVAARVAAAQQLLPGISQRAATGALTTADVAYVCALGLMEVLAARCVPGCGGGLAAALAMLRNVLAGADKGIRSYSLQHERLLEWFCQLAVACTVGPPQPITAGSEEADISPAAIRALLVEATSLYPYNMGLAQLVVVMEEHAHALTRLRQYLGTACAEHPSPHLLALIAMVETGRVASGVLGGVRALMERAAASQQLGSSHLLWIMYLRLEVGNGHLDAARRVFLRAMRQCPGCKQLWLEGLQALGASTAQVIPPALPATGAHGPTAGVRTRAGQVSGRATAGGLSPREVAELLAVMSEKGVKVHTEVAEVVMAELEEQQFA